MNRFRHAVAIVVLLAACSGAADPADLLSRQIVVGEFGGPNVTLHADAQSASVDLGCSLVQISAPLLTDDRGNFVLTGQRSRIGGAPPMPGEGTTPVRVNGHASDANGGTIELLIQPLPEAQGESNSVVAVRNQQANLLRCP